MPPIIIIESKLYHPYYHQILKKVIDAKAQFHAHEKIPYQDYENVLFPFAKFNIDAHSIHHSYTCLAHHTVIYQNENIFKQLHAMKFNFNIEGVSNNSMLATALELSTKENPTQEIRSILKMLLESETTDLNLFCSLRDQTALHYIAGVGDAHIEILNMILRKTKEFTSDIYGANALTRSIQECQYKTAEILLDTEQGQVLTNQPRKDGAYPLQIACEHMTDVKQGSAVVKKILQYMDPEVYRFSFFLFSAALSPNPNSDCKLAYCEILLENGVFTNEKSSYQELIIEMTTLYSIAKYQDNKKDQENYKKIFTLLVEYNFFSFKTPQEQKNYLEGLLVSNVKDLGLIIYKHAEENGNEVLLQLMGQMTTELGQDRAIEDSPEKQQDEFDAIKEEIRKISRYQDDQNQKFYFELMSKSILAQTIAVYQLVKMFHSGRLDQDGILKLITILDKKPECKKFIPYLYRQYLINVIGEFAFDAEKDKKENIILKLFLCLVKLVQHLPSITDEEESDNFKLEINAIMQKAIQLALLSAVFYAHRSLGKFIVWVDQIDSSYYDDETTPMILQLKITQAYFSENKTSFTEYYKKLDTILPTQHLLRRQYDYWQAELLFKKSDDENVVTLNNALSKLERHNLDVKLTESFRSQLDLRRKSEAKAKKVEKQKLKSDETSPATVDKKNDSPEKTATNNVVSSSSSTSTQSAIISNNNNNTYSEPSPKVKVKTRGIPFAEMLNNAMEELQERLQPQRLNPIFSEADIRKLYADILKPTDTLKPLSYHNKYGQYWVVCNFGDLPLEATDKERFTKAFKKSNTIHHAASSGFSLKKIFRLMLGHNDLRLHSTLYKNKVNSCSLIRLDEVWRHNDDSFNKRTCYIEDYKNSSKSLKK